MEMDWQSGTIDFELAGATGPTWSVIVASDWAPLSERGGTFVLAEPFETLTRNPERFYGNLLPVLRDADLTMVNLECVLGDVGSPIIKDGPHLQLPASAAEGLAAVPFDLACLANNHSMDFGVEGLTHTQELLEEKGISAVGAGRDPQDACQPFLTQIEDVDLAIINAAEGEEGCSLRGRPGVNGLDQDRLIQQIIALRDQVDVIIAVLHAGREWVPVPPPYVHRFYRSLAEAGADLVIGHHPHVPQGVEVHQGRPIAYSLGNFALWTPRDVPVAYLGYLLKASFRGAQLARVEIIPHRMLSDRLTMLCDDDRAAFLDDLALASRPLEDQSEVEAVWHLYADRWLERGLPKELTAIASLSVRRDIWARLAWRGIRALTGLAARLADEQREQYERRGAAVLRNLFDTPAHCELYLTALEKKMRGEREPSVEPASTLMDRWDVFG